MEEIAETNYVLLDKYDICKSSENSHGNLLIAIKTAPTNHEQRNVLRRTWLVEAIEHRIPYVFVIGNTNNQELMEKLLIEDKTYNDLLIGKPIDDYYNLTLKIVFLLAWTKHYCPTHWLLYIDDDTIVNIENAIDFVASQQNETDHVIYGTKMDQTVIREPESKWFVSMSIWPFQHYPSFLSGNGYMIPPNTLPLIHQTATNKSIEPKLWIDDVFITGIVTNASHVKLISSPLRCCAYGTVTLFNTSVLLGQMGEREKMFNVWKLIRENWTDSIQMKSSVFTSKTKISRFSREGYLLTTQDRNIGELFDLIALKHATYLIYYPLPFAIIFLMIIIFVRRIRRLFLAIFAKRYLKISIANVMQ